MDNKNERLLSTNEVARLLRVHPNTVRNMLQDGRLQALKTRGRTGQYRFREKDIQQYLEAEGAPNIFDNKAILDNQSSVVDQIPKQSTQLLQDCLAFLGDCGNPFQVFGSYLETATADQYSKQLTGKAAIWVEETLRQVQLRFEESLLSVYYPGTKQDFITAISVGVAAKKGPKGERLITSILIFHGIDEAKYLLDGTLQQFHPKTDKGVVLLPWKDRNLYYTGLEVISQSEFQAAVNDRNGTYFKAFILKVRRDHRS